MIVVKAYLRNGDWLKREVKDESECLNTIKSGLGSAQRAMREMNRAEQEAEQRLTETLDNFDTADVTRIEHWEKGKPTEMNVYKP